MSFAANVYQVKDGRPFAVAQGKTFEVTEETPFHEVGPARYYFADKESMSACADKIATLSAELEREAVSLATAAGNVTTDNYGRKYAVCPITEEKFLVRADSPAKVMNGEKYYVCSEECWQDLLKVATRTETKACH